MDCIQVNASITITITITITIIITITVIVTISVFLHLFNLHHDEWGSFLQLTFKSVGESD